MVVEVFVAMFGLATALTVHTYFYLHAYSRDYGFTGLLQKEEKIIMNSMVALGGLQILYFLWSYVRATFGSTHPAANILVHGLALGLLVVFSYHSYLLIVNMRKIREKYSIEVSWE